MMAGTAMPALLVAAASGAHAQSLPAGGQVVAGAATISQLGPNKLSIVQTTDRAAINWTNFSIGAGNSVNIQQPGSTSVELERVTTTNVSQIFGQLSSNGRVIITNPNGIYCGANSQVDVAGLVASTATATPANVASFVAGGSLNLGQAGNATASIVNQGTVTVSGAGLAAFVAPGVRNDGIIQARLGTVQLASGTTATLDFRGDGLISLAVTGQTLAQAFGPDGRPLKAAVANTGTLSADGGTVLLTANVASGVVDQAINVKGVVAATAVSQQGGEIVLDGGDNGAVRVAGSLDASGTGTGQTGGTVQVLGQNVNLTKHATIDVAGDVGGGTALIGGNFHGAAGTRTAATTKIAKGAIVNANAITTGNGGQVAVWSDRHTIFAGTITAQGGAQSGNGCRVETSGASLTVGDGATVNTSAARGASGLWLLDPNNITIAASGGDITPTTITAALSTGNVEIDTVDDPGASGTAGTIFVNSAVLYNSSHDLSLLAQGDIDANASIQNSGAGNLNLVAGWDGVTGLSGGGAGAYTGTVTIGTITGTPASYGNTIAGSAGSLFVNSATGTTGVAVGSAGGTTTVLGNNIALAASTVGGQQGGFAQIGFAIGSFAPLGGNSATGAIVVDAKGDVTLTGGGSGSVDGNYANYAQIGHGGFRAAPSGQLSGSITVNTGGSVQVTGGGVDNGNDYGSNYAQIGHGGWGAFELSNYSNVTLGVSGDAISVIAGGAVSLAANSAY